MVDQSKNGGLCRPFADARMLRILACVCLASACTSLNGGDEPAEESDASATGSGRGTKDGGPGRADRDGVGVLTMDGGDRDGGDGGQPVGPEPNACDRDPDACPTCEGDDDCETSNPCRTPRCNPETKRCESTPRRDGLSCALGSDQRGVCAAGECAQCIEDEDCAPTALTCRRSYCTPEHACSTEPRPIGAPCAGGFCSEQAECVECGLDENCGANGACEAEHCGCKPGYVPNAGGVRGCNFDECALTDDNRCGLDQFGGQCTNTDDGYDCACAAGTTKGPTDLGPQCYTGGTGAIVTVGNGATWNLGPTYGLGCSNAFISPPPPECPLADGKAVHGELTWLNVCGLGPGPCNAIVSDGIGLLTAKIQRASYSAALQDYGDPTGTYVTRIEDPVPGDVILVQTVTTLGVMRITAISNAELSFEWASIWRDHCFLPGGLSCTAACSCPGGS